LRVKPYLGNSFGGLFISGPKSPINSVSFSGKWLFWAFTRAFGPVWPSGLYFPQVPLIYPFLLTGVVLALPSLTRPYIFGGALPQFVGGPFLWGFFTPSSAA